jgi:hypothetical protein
LVFRRGQLESRAGRASLGRMKTRLLVLPALLWLAGCDTPTEVAEKKTANDEYVYVTVTGSNIPKRVRKSDIEKGTVPKDLQVQLADKDEFAQQMRSGRKLDKGN